MPEKDGGNLTRLERVRTVLLIFMLRGFQVAALARPQCLYRGEWSEGPWCERIVAWSLENEFVSGTVHGPEVQWISRISFQLLPQAQNVSLNRAACRTAISAPSSAQQL